MHPLFYDTAVVFPILKINYLPFKSKKCDYSQLEYIVLYLSPIYRTIFLFLTPLFQPARITEMSATTNRPSKRLQGVTIIYINSCVNEYI